MLRTPRDCAVKFVICLIVITVVYTALSLTALKFSSPHYEFFSTSFLKYILQLIYKEIEDNFTELRNELLTALSLWFFGVFFFHFSFSITVLRTDVMHGFKLISSFHK